jgi:hypothetical protein
MHELATGAEDSHSLSSVDYAKPEEEGGPIARSGFTYQDEIAVGFLLQMLDDPLLLKVHCETHDDMVLVCGKEGSAVRFAEFVQVKASEQDKLWSVADLSIRREGIGSSILERSLGRDKHIEDSRFRIVTLRPVVSRLKPLTFPYEAAGRQSEGEWFTALQDELTERLPELRSKKGNTIAYWLKYCLWDERYSREVVENSNLLKIIRFGATEARPLFPELAEILLVELRAKAKAAGDARWEPDPQKKIITREDLLAWWTMRVDEIFEGVLASSGGKLRKKMIRAGLPSEIIELAVELRRDYAAAARVSHYMEPRGAERLQRRVKADVMSLQAHLLSGRLKLNPLDFHALCLDGMDKINAELSSGNEDHSAFLKGCMYDIADRCLLRFERPIQ